MMINLKEDHKKRVIILLGILSIFSLIFIVYKTQQSRQEETKEIIPTPVLVGKIASFKEITPGEPFSEDKINTQLGYPLKTEEADGKKIMDFETSNKYRNHQIMVEGEIIAFIREVINLEDNIDTETIRKEYGVAPYTLYEKSPNSVFNLLVYPKNGIAYLGHEDSTVLEIWYFQPTDIDNFINLYAQNYQKEEFVGPRIH